MRFEFATATRILFGQDVIQEVPALAAEMGRRASVITGHTAERAATLLEKLAKEGVECTTFKVPCEPTVAMAEQAVLQARQWCSDVVIAVGGGSTIDTAKVVAAMLTNSGELRQYLEVVGDAKPLVIQAAPCIAIPSTAGTGAEVTRNAVLGVPEHRVKVSMRSSATGGLLPRLAVVDPLLTHSLPPALTASTGLDALTQLIEAFVCNRANPLTDSFCREGLLRVGRSLQRAYANGKDAAAREDMALASLLSGLALANAGLGAVHGLAAALGAMIPASHGTICGRLLPYVVETNIRALKARKPDSPALVRYDESARLLTPPGGGLAGAADLIRWTYELCSELNTRGLAEFGLKEEDFPAVAAKAAKASSMKANPVQLNQDELVGILKSAA